MNVHYEDAVKKLKECWKVRGRTISADDKAVVKSFRGFFLSGKKDYSPEVALVWLSDNQLMWDDEIYCRNRRVIYELNDAYLHGEISAEYDFTFTDYDLLPDGLKDALLLYRNELKSRLTYRPARDQLIHCVSFACFLKKQGILSPKGITVECISKYHDFADSIGDTYICLYSVRYFLEFLVTSGTIPSHVPYVLTSPLQARAIGYAVGHFSGDCSEFDNEGLSPRDLWEKSREFIALMKERHHYNPDFLRNSYLAYFQMLYIFNSEFSIPYTKRNTDIWRGIMKDFWEPTHQAPSVNRCFYLMDVYLATGDISRDEINKVFSDAGKIQSLSAGYSLLVHEFMAAREKENAAPATLDVHKSGSVSFLLYMQEHGICDVSDITMRNVKEYCSWVAESAVNHKNNYSYDIRTFLRFCFERGITSADLSRAMPVQSGQQRKIIKVLSEEEIQKIYDYRDCAVTQLQLRDAAILMLGLLIGLRRIDVVNLRLSNIDWKNQTISITQQKTYRPLVIPMPVPVGNSIYKYICSGRPKTSDETDYIFLSTTAPYERTHCSACGLAVQHALGGSSKSFHTLRRTFASRLLSAGTNTDTIKDSLGHSTMDTVNRYLSTDEEGLRSCCLPLERTVIKNEATA